MVETCDRCGAENGLKLKLIIKRVCPICNQEFTPTKEHKNRKQKFCSKECWSKRNPPTVKSCLICQKEFKTYSKERESKIYCSYACRNKAYTGRKLSLETIEKIKLSHKGIIPKNAWKPGKLHPFWNPNRTDSRERDTIDYTNWRLAVLKRDNFTCQICGARGKKGFRPILHADHIKPFSIYPELRTMLSNGRTICIDCHKKTDTWGRKKAKKILN